MEPSTEWDAESAASAETGSANAEPATDDAWSNMLELSMLDRDEDLSRGAILVVEDSQTVARLLEWELCMAGYRVELAANGKEGLRAARAKCPDLILADVMMPEMDGFELARRLRQDRATAEVALIFVTARGLSADRMQGLAAGGDDYIVKPFESADLLTRIERVLRASREAKDQSPLTSMSGAAKIQGELERRLRTEESFALLLVDLGGFGSYNDRYGFARGDRVLQMTARVVKDVCMSVVGPSGFVGHLGGDDFVVIVKPEEAGELRGALVAAFSGRIGSLYDPDDERNGYVQLVDRDGRVSRHPLVTLSVGIASSAEREFYHPAEVLQRARDAAEIATAPDAT
jgi:PleD family two-component response regulator